MSASKPSRLNEEVIKQMQYTKPKRKQNSPIQYFRMKGGFMISQDGDSVDVIQGELYSVSLREDPGNPQYKIKPNTVVSATLKTDSGLKVIQSNTNAKVACTTFLNGLLATKQGDTIAISTEQGADQRVTFANVHILNLSKDGFNSQIFSKTEESMEERMNRHLEEIKQHDAFWDGNSEDNSSVEESSEEKTSDVDMLTEADLNW